MQLLKQNEKKKKIGKENRITVFCNEMFANIFKNINTYQYLGILRGTSGEKILFFYRNMFFLSFIFGRKIIIFRSLYRSKRCAKCGS